MIDFYKFIFNFYFFSGLLNNLIYKKIKFFIFKLNNN